MTTFQKAQKKQLDPVSQVLLWFAGVDVKILQQIDSPIDIIKYTALGITIAAACSFAGFSAFIFMSSIEISDFYSIRGSDIKIVFSIIWGIFIFAVDRFLLTSFKKKEFSWSRVLDIQLYLSVIFRLALCFVIASFVATEIELSIFSSEISEQLIDSDTQKIKEKQGKNSDKIYSASPKIAQIISDINTQETNIAKEKEIAENLGNELTIEANGTGGSGTRGSGGIYDKLEKRQQASLTRVKNQENQLEKLKKSKDTEVSPYQDRINKESKEIEDKIKSSGSLEKKEALEVYLHEKPAARLHAYRIQALLNLIELIPVIFKILSPYSDYDKALHYEGTRKSNLNKIHADNDTQIYKHKLEIELMEANLSFDIQKKKIDKLNEKIDELAEPLVAEYSKDFHESRQQSRTKEEETSNTENGSKNKILGNNFSEFIADVVAIVFSGTRDRFTACIKIFGNVFNWLLRR
jgi:hypothetical protein